MARTKQKKNKEAKVASKKAKAAAKSESLYGKLPFKLRSHDKLKSDTRSSSFKRKKNKQEAAAKTSLPLKVKAKTKHHVAKFPRHSIKHCINAAADLKQSSRSDSFSDRRFGKFNLGRPSKQRKIRRGKKLERIEFQMDIPDANHEHFLKPDNVPWFEAERQERFRENVPAIPDGKVNTSEINKYRAATSNDDEVLQLPSNQVLSHIDAEIQSFAAYVKLTPSERKARDAFLSHISHILTTQFANGGKGRRKQNHEDGDHEICVEPFGSYATQEVCTFASDVDMCLWGLVKEEEKPSHLKFVSSDSNETNDEEDTCLLNDQRGECPLLTESSLLRTMDAIQSAQTIQKYDKKLIVAADKTTPVDVANVADECLYVIDRTGIGMDPVEEKEEISSNIIDSKKQSLDCNAHNHAKDTNSKTKKARSKNISVAKEQFEFVIDRDGVAELGGNFDDLPPSDKSKAQLEEHLSAEKSSDGNFEQARQGEVSDQNTREPNKDVDVAAKNTSDGTSYEKAINIGDDSSDEEVILVDDISSDEADKLDSFYSRRISSESNKTVNLPLTSEKYVNVSADTAAKSSLKEKDVISVCDSSNECESDFNESSREAVLELSITSFSTEHTTNAPRPTAKPVFGPTGKTRIRVVSVLQGLTSHLRRSSFTNTVACRSKARVPIVNCNTRTGFEGDIAIGGHNGMDTSTYARTQVGRFISFAPIVLILKVLMVQQGLDKPFTGGLGSYKLYVLVAHHIESHLANGGNDRPSEILISILFRYSCVGSIKDKATTDLESLRNDDGLIASGDGVCDLAPVFRLPDIVEMFRECHERLLDRILLVEGFEDVKSSANLSYLSSMIDCFRLKEARESSDKRSRLSDDITRPIGRNHPGKVSNSRRVGKVFSKNEYPSDPKRKIPTSFVDSKKRRLSLNDPPINLQQAKRGPRGGLVPRNRPDEVAAKSLKANPENELLLRGTKNRKNKKKQMRDDALRVFSRRSI